MRFVADQKGILMYMPQSDVNVAQSVWLSNTRAVIYLNNSNFSSVVNMPYNQTWCTGNMYWYLQN